jgi:polysaccharide export outer membrane protein
MRFRRLPLIAHSQTRLLIAGLFLLGNLASSAATGGAADPQVGQTNAPPRALSPQQWLQTNFPELVQAPIAPAHRGTNGPSQAESRPTRPNSSASASAAVQAAPPAQTSGRADVPSNATATTPVPQPQVPNNGISPKGDQLQLREGDVLRISFPGVPTLNTLQQIRRDGNVTLPIIGEFKAAGMTPSEAQEQLVRLYDPHLQVKEVRVAVESSTFFVYVTGAVLRPGKIISDRPMSALEAVVEAGVDHTKANLKKVRVTRRENGRKQVHVLNLKNELSDRKGESFDLKPSDVIYVPERLDLF